VGDLGYGDQGYCQFAWSDDNVFFFRFNYFHQQQKQRFYDGLIWVKAFVLLKTC